MRRRECNIATQEKNESQLAKYREKKPLWSNVAVGRILSNEQYTGTMVYSRFKSENVGDKHSKALPEKEWKRVENCHVAIISKEDFEKVASMRKGNTCASAERKHETHCLTGKMICGNCGHRLAHSYSGRPKYYCAKHYLDKADGKCNIGVLDETMEEVVMRSLQLFIDMWVDSRKIVDMQREKQVQRLKLAEQHLIDMETATSALIGICVMHTKATSLVWPIWKLIWNRKRPTSSCLCVCRKTWKNRKHQSVSWQRWTCRRWLVLKCWKDR